MQVVLHVGSPDSFDVRDSQSNPIELDCGHSLDVNIGGDSLQVFRLWHASDLGVVDWTPIGIVNGNRCVFPAAGASDSCPKFLEHRDKLRRTPIDPAVSAREFLIAKVN